MQDFEKLGLFYLGREHDLPSGKTSDRAILYESRDLLTHAVCLGMTGSGKTGLCLALIEEAAIDGVPVLAIDPKGDIGNLLLTFPRLAPQDFRPWIDEDEARRAGQDPDAFAAAEAQRWKAGLAAWGEDGARIERLRNAAEFTIYTPGSTAGLPVSVLSSFSAPPAAAREDAELLAERASTAATSLLALAGIDAQPRSREHTLLSTVLTTAWRGGADVDLASLIPQVQTPSFQKVGIVDLESFFPAKERFELAMRLNGLLAAPGFEQWLEGEPLDPAVLLRTSDGRPRVSVFSIAHLGDAERMFFVALLLNQIVAWMRTQSGTSSLRAIVYMDEILGYFPPVANPPAKAPLLTLLKQGRAFGMGVVLATQNPVDLDYKGLANTGTWFLGRLQTERDKGRVLDGLEGAAAGGIDRAHADRVLSALGKRVFLLHNVHAGAPQVFETRWTMSYLRGPLSREEIRKLTAGRKDAGAAVPASSASAAPAAAASGSVKRTRVAGPSDSPVAVVPPGIQQFFVEPADSSAKVEGYDPVALGAARVTFSDSKLEINETRDVLYAADITDAAVPVDWARASRVDATAAALRREPRAQASRSAVPAAALQPKNYADWEKAFARWLTQNETLERFRHRASKLTSRAGESERDFRVRVQEGQRAARDAAVDDVRKKYAVRQTQLQDRLKRAEASVSREEQQASQQKLQTALSIGATIAGALFGRRALSTSTLGRATTAARGMGRTMKESEDIKRANESADSVREQIRQLEEQVAQETQRIAAEFDAAIDIERLSVLPKRGQVAVQFVALGWLPDTDAH
jgi:hypothetical protein